MTVNKLKINYLCIVLLIIFIDYVALQSGEWKQIHNSNKSNTLIVDSENRIIFDDGHRLFRYNLQTDYKENLNIGLDKGEYITATYFWEKKDILFVGTVENVILLGERAYFYELRGGKWLEEEIAGGGGDVIINDYCVSDNACFASLHGNSTFGGAIYKFYPENYEGKQKNKWYLDYPVSTIIYEMYNLTNINEGDLFSFGSNGSQNLIFEKDFYEKKSWNERTTNDFIKSVSYDSINKIIYAINNKNKLLISNDEGVNFTEQTGFSPGSNVLDIFATKDYLYVATENTGLYKYITKDKKGENIDIAEGIYKINAISVSDTMIAVASNKGIWINNRHKEDDTPIIQKLSGTIKTENNTLLEKDIKLKITALNDGNIILDSNIHTGIYNYNLKIGEYKIELTSMDYDIFPNDTTIAIAKNTNINISHLAKKQKFSCWGYVKLYDNPLEDVLILCNNDSLYSDKSGYYLFDDLDKGKYEIKVYHNKYCALDEDKEVQIETSDYKLDFDFVSGIDDMKIINKPDTILQIGDTISIYCDVKYRCKDIKDIFANAIYDRNTMYLLNENIKSEYNSTNLQKIKFDIRDTLKFEILLGNKDEILFNIVDLVEMLLDKELKIQQIIKTIEVADDGGKRLVNPKNKPTVKTIYPNPASDNIVLTIYNPINSKVKIEVYNNYLEKVLSWDSAEIINGEVNQSINVSELSSGEYLFVISNTQMATCVKLMIIN
jgi:hypothetical protein